MDLLLADHPVRDWTVVEVEGDIDLSTAGQLRDHLTRLLDSKQKRVVVDLTGVEFMDSSGLGALVATLKRAKESEGELALICPEGSVLKVFSITGLDRVFRVFAERSDIPG